MKLSDVSAVRLITTTIASVCVVGGMGLAGASFVGNHFEQVDDNSEAVRLAESEREEDREQMKAYGEVLKNMIIRAMIESCLEKYEEIDECPEYKEIINTRFPEHSSKPKLMSAVG